MPPASVASDLPLGDFLLHHCHAFTRAEILSRWSRHHLERALDRADVERILPGVYTSSTATRHPVVMGEAATLWAPRAMITGSLALHLYAPSFNAPNHVDLVTEHGDTLHPPSWITVHQTGVPDARGFPQGVRAVTPGRALIDAWRACAPRARLDLLWRALWAGSVTAQEISAEAENWSRFGGRRVLEQVLGWFADGATSPLEVRAKHETFAAADFRGFEWQAAIVAAGRHFRVDMLHRRAMVVIELDGDRYHSTRDAREADRARQNALVAEGFTVLRFSWRDITRAPEECRAQVRAAISRASRSASHSLR